MLALLAFSNSFPGGYITDDIPIIRDSPLVRTVDVRAIFASDYWGSGAGSGLYRPVTILSYAVNKQLFGSDPASFHAVNVLLHSAVAVLSFSVFTTVGVPAALSWLASALFAVHPIHTEVVDIVTGRAELLAALFVLLGIRAALLRRPGHRVVTSFWYCLALLSKEHAVTFLPLLVVIDLFSARECRTLVRERWPLYVPLCAVTAVWLAYRKWGLLSGSLPGNLPYPIDNPLTLLGPLGRILTAVKVQLLYLGRLVVPVRLDAIFVDTMIGPVHRLGSFWGGAVVLAPLVAGVLLFQSWQRRQPWALGLAFHAVAFSVTANIFFLTPFLMAERFAYLPSVGFCLVLAAGIQALTVRLGWHRVQGKTFILATVVLVLFSARTLVRNRDFSDSVTLWSAETGNEPANVRAWILLAGAYADNGALDRAETALRRALKIRPEFTEAQLMMGFLLLEVRRPAESADFFHKVIDSVPGESPLAMLGLARAYLDLGMTAKAVQWIESIPDYFRHLDSYRDLASRIAAAASSPALPER